MSESPPAWSTRSSTASRQRSGASAPPTGHAYQPGDVIAEKYELERVIGTGGMGAVWFAKNLILNIDVAIKLIRSDVASEDASARLLVEARSAAQLDHPSIVRIHDFGMTHRGDPYIVMELLNGDSLGAIADRRGRLAPTEAVRLVLPIVDALSLAHARGIVHRDLKPDNVILSIAASGGVVPKLVDFGIAKLGHQSNAPPASETPLPGMTRLKSRLTSIGAVIGSPQYMAPEQAEGSSDVDARADIWAICVLLYELVSGHRPFEPEDPDDTNELMIAIMVQAPVPLTAHLDHEASLWEILQRGLEKAPADRWPDAIELGRALAQWLMDRGERTDVTGAALPERWGSPDRAPRRDDPTSESQARRSPAQVTTESPPSELIAAEGRAATRIRLALLAGAIGTLVLGAFLMFGASPSTDQSNIRAPSGPTEVESRDEASLVSNSHARDPVVPDSTQEPPDAPPLMLPTAMPGAAPTPPPKFVSEPVSTGRLPTGGAPLAPGSAPSAEPPASPPNSAPRDLAIPDSPNF